MSSGQRTRKRVVDLIFDAVLPKHHIVVVVDKVDVVVDVDVVEQVAVYIFIVLFHLLLQLLNQLTPVAFLALLLIQLGVAFSFDGLSTSLVHHSLHSTVVFFRIDHIQLKRTVMKVDQ